MYFFEVFLVIFKVIQLLVQMITSNKLILQIIQILYINHFIVFNVEDFM
jgi:hypothetical protein